jgi:hypothetical protein
MFIPRRKHGPLRYVTGDSFTFLYMNDVRTSQETSLANLDGFLETKVIWIKRIIRISEAYDRPKRQIIKNLIIWEI